VTGPCGDVTGNLSCVLNQGHAGSHRDGMCMWEKVDPGRASADGDPQRYVLCKFCHRTCDAQDLQRHNLKFHPEMERLRHDGGPVWDTVIADMRSRDEVGRVRYGEPLRLFNGRDSLRDAYEESLDTAVYIRARLMEDEVLRREADLILQQHTRGDWATVEQTYCSTCNDAGPVNWPCDAARLAMLILKRSV
jgi:hypothetical protein